MELLILDELGDLPFNPPGGALSFHRRIRLNEQACAMITTNLDFAEGSSVF